MGNKRETKGKILLIRLSSLGDVIFNIPLANTLKRNGYEVTWAVTEKGYDIINGNPCVDKAVLVPLEKWKTNLSFFPKLKEYLKLRKEILKGGFDIAIDTQGLLKSSGFMAFSGIKRKIVGSNARELSYLAGNEFVKFPKGQDWEFPIIRKYLRYAEPLGLDTQEIEITLPPATPETQEKIKTLLEGLDRSKPIATICPVTTWDPKHWDKDNWKKLVKEIEDKYTLIFTGTSRDMDYIEYINEGKHLNLAGKTNLLELIELFRNTDLVLSLDSGSTHLAWATQVPKIVSIFCCTPAKLYEPIGEKYISVTGELPCQPCHRRKCPKEGKDYNACTKVPTVEEVLEAINHLQAKG